MGVEIKLEPCTAPRFSIMSVGGIRVGTVEKLSDESWLPFGCKKPRSLEQAALHLVKAKYDSLCREVEKYGLLVRELRT